MGSNFSRRDFLRLSALTLGSLAFRPLLPPDDRVPSLGRARVAADLIYLYAEPDFQSARVGERRRDHLVDIFEEVQSPHGPEHNPLWYRLIGGYAHCGRLQRVETLLFPPLTYITKPGRICEVSVPFVDSLRYKRGNKWIPLYRLYYQSHHWVTAVDLGPDKKPWYKIIDERLRVSYHVPASHMRPLPRSEFTPLSPDIPPEDKRIQVSITDQILIAYEGDQAVFQARVSTGIHSKSPTPNGIPTDTPTGRFRISNKMPVRHMGDGGLTSNIYAYELPGVPWCGFFVSSGVAFHGTYWHNNFGRPMSHGCVNMRNEDAQWLYRWTTPVSPANKWYTTGTGTTVDVI